MPRFRLISTHPVLDTPRFRVTHDRAETPQGDVLERAIVQHPGAVVMLPVDGHGRVLLIRQYRLPPRKYLWELPAGTRDPKETPLRAARRELAEETGYRARKWKKLLSFYTAPGFCDERMTAYLAHDLTLGQAKPEPYEKIETHWWEWPQAIGMIANGNIKDAKTVATLLFASRFELVE